ncbi:Hypothetical_protein [Hexamita inflata]|uniref:Hypothetical_protein n=1 Tax=Hexamita inflata TaxID=28002 RepID=A0AA86TIN8_9EUKA|nr:Hypothetical protein HINF_LOCUS7439 [Hexamita inflata]
MVVPQAQPQWTLISIANLHRSCTKTVHILHFEKILRIPLVFGVLSTLLARFAQHFERYSSYTKKFSNIHWLFRFIRAKFKLSNLCFSVSFGFILATQKLKLNLARRRDTVVRDMEIPRRAQYFSAMILEFRIYGSGIFNNAKISAQSNF